MSNTADSAGTLLGQSAYGNDLGSLVAWGGWADDVYRGSSYDETYDGSDASNFPEAGEDRTGMLPLAGSWPVFNSETVLSTVQVAFSAAPGARGTTHIWSLTDD